MIAIVPKGTEVSLNTFSNPIGTEVFLPVTEARLREWSSTFLVSVLLTDGFRVEGVRRKTWGVSVIISRSCKLPGRMNIWCWLPALIYLTFCPISSVVFIMKCRRENRYLLCAHSAAHCGDTWGKASCWQLLPGKRGTALRLASKLWLFNTKLKWISLGCVQWISCLFGGKGIDYSIGHHLVLPKV